MGTDNGVARLVMLYAPPNQGWRHVTVALAPTIDGNTNEIEYFRLSAGADLLYIHAADVCNRPLSNIAWFSSRPKAAPINSHILAMPLSLYN